MHLSERIEAFSKLGNSITQIIEDEKKKPGSTTFSLLLSKSANEWYTPSNIMYMLEWISKNLKYNVLIDWTEKYPDLENQKTPKKIGLITAGNIPLVGFHDVLCILISGHKLIIKNSSKDENLMNWFLNLLIKTSASFKEYIQIETCQLKEFDAVIATGSNNTSKYFEYYFGKYPHIIRKSRNSIAVLTGNETETELELLADDILLYFGLGCRNVSKLFIPVNYDIQQLFKAVSRYDYLINHNKYANNHIYNRSIFLMNKTEFLDNNFLILKEDPGMNSPISVLFYERYEHIEKVKEKLENDKDKIQCIVAREGITGGSVGFGQSQKPALSDYADHVDTLNFLISIQ